MSVLSIVNNNHIKSKWFFTTLGDIYNDSISVGYIIYLNIPKILSYFRWYVMTEPNAI